MTTIWQGPIKTKRELYTRVRADLREFGRSEAIYTHYARALLTGVTMKELRKAAQFDDDLEKLMLRGARDVTQLAMSGGAFFLSTPDFERMSGFDDSPQMRGACLWTAFWHIRRVLNRGDEVDAVGMLFRREACSRMGNPRASVAVNDFAEAFGCAVTEVRTLLAAAGFHSFRKAQGGRRLSFEIGYFGLNVNARRMLRARDALAC